MKLIKSLLIIITLSLPIQQVSASSLENSYNAEYISNYDGDTIKFRINIWHNQYVIESVRIRGIDTPEIHGKCEIEKRLALKAKNFTKKVLTSVENISIHNLSVGKFGRTIANVKVDNNWLGKLLLNKSYTEKYTTNKNYCE